jgi:hypothetical protein
MNIDKLMQQMDRINQIQSTIKNTSLVEISKNIAIQSDDIRMKEDYYAHLSPNERYYQRENDKYKKLISQFSQAYLEICDFYVGPEIPRETYLDSKKDVYELYFLFSFFAYAEPYINAYHQKYNM